jgi:hypothetical protein
MPYGPGVGRWQNVHPHACFRLSIASNETRLAIPLHREKAQDGIWVIPEGPQIFDPADHPEDFNRTLLRVNHVGVKAGVTSKTTVPS